jgi:hypothetical protein
MSSGSVVSDVLFVKSENQDSCYLFSILDLSLKRFIIRIRRVIRSMLTNEDRAVSDMFRLFSSF